MPDPVSISIGPALSPWVQIFDYAGGANLVYSGWAKSGLASSLPTIDSATKAAACELTFHAAHALPTGAVVRIFLTGVTGTGWTALNAAAGLVATVTASNKVTVPIDSQAFGTFGGTIVVTTTAPLTSQAVWAIQFASYSGSNLLFTAYAEGGVKAINIWDNRALLAYS